MTQEEKAKAYDEALGKAKNALRTDLHESGAWAIKRIFPELRESEDERIRKMLIEQMERWKKMAEENGVEQDVNDATSAIAYLEKQKEQKPINSYKPTYEQMEALRFAVNHLAKEHVSQSVRLSIMYDHLKEQDEQKDYNKLYEDIAKSEWFKKAYEGKSLGCDYEQKEQKPKESISQLTVQGEGVYKICPHCKSRMIRDDSKVYTSMPPQYGYHCPKCGTMEFDTVMYDSPEMEEQKPVEWSEEDELAVDIIKKALDTSNAMTRTGYMHAISFLEKLEEQKPAQTVDEKEYIRTIKGIIADFIRDKQPEDVAFYQKIYDWLDGRHIEQEPAEWSNLDIDSLGDAITATDMLGNDEKYKKSNPNLAKAFRVAKDWLKSLPERFNLLPKQEWSEEEKGILLECVSTLQHRGHWVLADKLSSLRPRPHWKPSEEQMEALLKLEEKYVLEHERIPETAHLYMVIKSLREQLLKLRRGEL